MTPKDPRLTTPRVENPWITRAPADAPRAGILVLHTWWGLQAFTHRVISRLSEAGFIVIAPDFYAGETATNLAEARALMNRTTPAEKLALCQQALSELQRLAPESWG